MWGKYLAKWLAAVKQWGPVRVSWGTRGSEGLEGAAAGIWVSCARLRDPPYSLPRGERICWMRGNKNIPRLVCTHHRFRGATEPAHMDNRRPIQPSCWDNLSTTGTSFNLARNHNPPFPKRKTYCLQNSWLALPCPAHFLSRCSKLDQTGFSDRFQRSLSRMFSLEIIKATNKQFLIYLAC